MIRTIVVINAILMLNSIILSQAIQKEFPILRGPYLGQKPPGIVPEIFGQGIISTENGWEAALSFSPDLCELFFTYRPSLEGTENRLMNMRMINNVWSRPQNASFAQDVMEYEAYITPDYTKVIFNSQREKPRSTKGTGWYSQRENNGWGIAKYLPGPLNDGWIMSITSTLDGTLYFTGSYGDGYGIYRSMFINGEYTKPEFLPKEINKSKYFGESHPFIAPDESYLIFDAGAGTNNSDLYISYRIQEGLWTKAVAFDKTINSKDYEGIATVSPDGKYLFFQRNNDIYWVSAKLIEELSPK